MTNKKAIRAQYHGNEDKGMDIMIVVLELATLEHTELSYSSESKPLKLERSHHGLGNNEKYNPLFGWNRLKGLEQRNVAYECLLGLHQPFDAYRVYILKPHKGPVTSS